MTNWSRHLARLATELNAPAERSRELKLSFAIGDSPEVTVEPLPDGAIAAHAVIGRAHDSGVDVAQLLDRLAGNAIEASAHGCIAIDPVSDELVVFRRFGLASDWPEDAWLEALVDFTRHAHALAQGVSPGSASTQADEADASLTVPLASLPLVHPEPAAALRYLLELHLLGEATSGAVFATDAARTQLVAYRRLDSPGPSALDIDTARDELAQLAATVARTLGLPPPPSASLAG